VLIGNNEYFVSVNEGKLIIESEAERIEDKIEDAKNNTMHDEAEASNDSES
jgi:hypothetical protein